MDADEQGWGDRGGLNEHKLWQTQTARHKERRAQVMLNLLPLFSPSSSSNLLSLLFFSPPCKLHSLFKSPLFSSRLLFLPSSNSHPWRREPLLKSSCSCLTGGCNYWLTRTQDAVVFPSTMTKRNGSPRSDFSHFTPLIENQGLCVGFNWHHYNNHRWVERRRAKK